ncbi:hypothetical protein ACIQXW_23250 [Lysinibacillus sp. NPDC097162]|uniref:hypothetical protein n=1 Tax=Lysinibacillus sp. NPDC097162 TaxID=3364140 RepID=UPI0037FF6E9F
MNRRFLTDEQVAEELRESMRILGISCMPTGPELLMIDRSYLHSRLQRTGTYREWSRRLGVPLKSSTTTKGNDCEIFIAKKLISMGHVVENMTARFPYDLLVDSDVKIDVKCANKYKDKYSFDAWTFNLAKARPTCDIYILVAYNEDQTINRELVIPSKFLHQKTVSLGGKSTYDVYHEAYDYVNQYSTFYKKVTQL